MRNLIIDDLPMIECSGPYRYEPRTMLPPSKTIAVGESEHDRQQHDGAHHRNSRSCLFQVPAPNQRTA